MAEATNPRRSIHMEEDILARLKQVIVRDKLLATEMEPFDPLNLTRETVLWQWGFDDLSDHLLLDAIEEPFDIHEQPPWEVDETVTLGDLLDWIVEGKERCLRSLSYLSGNVHAAKMAGFYIRGHVMK